ncbi:hypothetical protein HKD37_13G038419 [Glycine soja]
MFQIIGCKPESSFQPDPILPEEFPVPWNQFRSYRIFHFLSQFRVGYDPGGLCLARFMEFGVQTLEDRPSLLRRRIFRQRQKNLAPSHALVLANVLFHLQFVLRQPILPDDEP